MHSWLLGIIKIIIEALNDPTYKSEPFYLRNVMDLINELLLEIKPPTEITRCPRAIGEKYEASEWKNLALYYFLPQFKDVLPKKYYDHVFLMIFARHILLKFCFSLRTL